MAHLRTPRSQRGMHLLSLGSDRAHTTPTKSRAPEVLGLAVAITTVEYTRQLTPRTTTKYAQSPDDPHPVPQHRSSCCRSHVVTSLTLPTRLAFRCVFKTREAFKTLLVLNSCVSNLQHHRMYVASRTFNIVVAVDDQQRLLQRARRGWRVSRQGRPALVPGAPRPGRDEVIGGTVHVALPTPVAVVAVRVRHVFVAALPAGLPSPFPFPFASPCPLPLSLPLSFGVSDLRFLRCRRAGVLLATTR